ncbi:MAG: glycosyltransferase family 9 protein [Verrucomicrobia bacterium]|nr:glycosyltransferase family 9 protein [Verrucomicrobiota bacterium]
MKNKLIKAILWALTPKETRPRHDAIPSKFLIVSTTGLGDTLWGTPAIRSLRQSFPESTIAVLTSEIGYEVLQHNKHIDEFFVLNSSTIFSLLRLLPTLKKQQFDAILVFHTSQRAVLPFCALLEAPQIIGTAGINKDLDFLLTKPLKKTYQHEIARRLDIIKQVGAHVADYSLEMMLRKEDEQAAGRFLDTHGIPSHIPLVGLHPGAKNSFKQWPPECFIEVGRRLVQHLGCQILISGDRSEALLLLDIASKIPGAIPIAGELNLSTFTALLKKMSLFITNDTGPMHLAFAAKTPTVALFGPTDPNLCGPFHIQNAITLSVPKTCRPCLGKPCAEPFCLYQIGPDQVYDAALELSQYVTV